MTLDNLFIVTAQPEFLDEAVNELRRLDNSVRSIEMLAPDSALCTASNVQALMRLAAGQLEQTVHSRGDPLWSPSRPIFGPPARPIFVRHLAPAQAIVDRTNTEQDVGKLAMAIASLPTFELLERGQRFAVQTRIVQSDENPARRPYSSGRLNQLLAEAIAQETGAVENIKKPQIIVSLLCTAERAYLGISTAYENLSDWPGGRHRFAETPEQISRAEFKLLEALEVFGVSLPAGGRALDLGAAPGGWTRLLLEGGMQVVAVDPARLDPRLKGQRNLEYYQGYAETYLEDALRKHKTFDVIANDMRMDARDAARLLVKAGNCLRPDGFILSTMKLPHATRNIDPLKTLREALSILRKHFRIVEARQLFHNRQEVTVVAAQPFAGRR